LKVDAAGISASDPIVINLDDNELSKEDADLIKTVELIFKNLDEIQTRGRTLTDLLLHAIRTASFGSFIILI